MEGDQVIVIVFVIIVVIVTNVRLMSNYCLKDLLSDLEYWWSRNPNSHQIGVCESSERYYIQ